MVKGYKLYIVYLFLISVFIPLNLEGQTEFKVMFYNLLNYPNEDAVEDREQDLEIILSDFKPDLFLVCELNTETGANSVLNITKSSISNSFEMASYITNTSDDDRGDENELQNQLYFDSDKIILVEQTEVPTELRDFNIYRLRLKTTEQDINPIEFLVVICHLKSSSGSTNAQIRFEMVQELDNYLSTIPSETLVLLGGDLNLYTASESAFQELLDGSNNVVFADPVNRIGSWNNNPSFVDVFTQSTRTQSGLGGATGGFDDRFDFILVSDNMLSSADLKYKEDSYEVYGNNKVASCYNQRINSSDCAGDLYSFEVRNALYNFSDHLPVTVTLETEAKLLSVENFNIETDLKIFHSYDEKQITIYNSYPTPIDASFNIYDIQGRIVIKNIKLKSGATLVNVENLTNGVYFLTDRLNKQLSKKFVVVN